MKEKGREDGGRKKRKENRKKRGWDGKRKVRKAKGM